MHLGFQYFYAQIDILEQRHHSCPHPKQDNTRAASTARRFQIQPQHACANDEWVYVVADPETGRLAYRQGHQR